MWIKQIRYFAFVLLSERRTPFRAGMQAGDIVLEINGGKVNTSEEVYKAVRSSDEITMQVQRGRELLRLRVTPEFLE